MCERQLPALYLTDEMLDRYIEKCLKCGEKHCKGLIYPNPRNIKNHTDG